MNGLCQMKLAEKYLVIGNGPHDDALAQLVKRLSDWSLVAVDGAGDWARQYGCVPQMMVGDFDSVSDPDYWGIQADSSSAEPYQGHDGVWIVPKLGQEMTDLEKAIILLDPVAVKQVILASVDGGRLDHSYYNLHLLRRYHHLNRPMWLWSDSFIVEYVIDRQVALVGAPGDLCGCFGFPAATITSQGLVYEMHAQSMTFSTGASCSNQMRQANAMLDVSGEALVLHPRHVAFFSRRDLG